ncbi:MAG TPA: RES family NAD+ phosphorylase [Vicinamibacteria bacterium]|nr:RES family NAD+ phosphorylase [Vicinamibacteria bacterium]
MSSSIWTRCGAASNLKPLTARPFRSVEAQHLVSTRKLTNSDAEQILLEDILEASKPPPGEGTSGLHYLLYTPFRYPPLAHGSRFGARNERGIWYGSETLHTCFAEVAYYRFVFLEGTAAELAPLLVELTTFQARVRTARAIDLTRAPFDAYATRISSPTRYETSQRLGREMRADGVEAVRYASARDPAGVSYALLSPRAFSAKRPQKIENWLCVATREAVEISKKEHRRHRETWGFVREQFEVRGQLPSPAT